MSTLYTRFTDFIVKQANGPCQISLIAQFRSPKMVDPFEKKLGRTADFTKDVRLIDFGLIARCMEARGMQ
ncbi:unnamed protein product [Bursaphelenchus xylophilus]|uniref:(pine wood nematode) hypothetical protein n=1 Tax=Bursaphelenchus xylophilus TaxID=6326 RepID=A0A1I7SI30_BURXY|nr:unnamed protein product [Bursaphelenchus xylophilus]CAG9113187.1 unnamed protein product [Bursaphelenchus xylophilus]